MDYLKALTGNAVGVYFCCLSLFLIPIIVHTSQEIPLAKS